MMMKFTKMMCKMVNNTTKYLMELNGASIVQDYRSYAFQKCHRSIVICLVSYSVGYFGGTHTVLNKSIYNLTQGLRNSNVK
jgi:hypothetical protein